MKLHFVPRDGCLQDTFCSMIYFYDIALVQEYNISSGVLPIDRLVSGKTDLSHISIVQEGAPGKSKSCLILQEECVSITPTIFFSLALILLVLSGHLPQSCLLC